MPSQRTVTRFTFGLTMFTLVVAMTLGEVILARTISRWCGVDLESSGMIGGLNAFKAGLTGGIVGGFMAFDLLFARWLTDQFFKTLRLSGSGRMVETRGRVAEEVRESDDLDLVILRHSPSSSNMVTGILLGCVVLVFIISEIPRPGHPRTGRVSLRLLDGWILGLAALAYARRYAKIMRIDAQGLKLPGIFPWSRPSPIPWKRIATCDLVTIRNPFGKVAVVYPVFKDQDGNDLCRPLAGGFLQASQEDRQRVLKFLTKRFPKLDRDPFEL